MISEWQLQWLSIIIVGKLLINVLQLMMIPVHLEKETINKTYRKGISSMY